MARMLFLTLMITASALHAVPFNDAENATELLQPGNEPLFKMTAQLAHGLIAKQQPGLLGDGSQLVSLYYFGQNSATSVVGLERVGDEYLPIRWLLVFKNETLLGWYYPISEFPARFNEGHLIFPTGASAEDVYLFPEPPKLIEIEGAAVPFISSNLNPALQASRAPLKK